MCPNHNTFLNGKCVNCGGPQTEEQELTFTTMPMTVKVPVSEDGEPWEIQLHKVQFAPLESPPHEKCEFFNKGKCVTCGKKNPLVGKPVDGEIIVEAAKQLKELYDQLPLHERFPNHQCGECNGTGKSSDPQTNGMCWDCQGQGVFPA